MSLFIRGYIFKDLPYHDVIFVESQSRVYQRSSAFSTIALYRRLVSYSIKARHEKSKTNLLM
jgi:hypothetical protein